VSTVCSYLFVVHLLYIDLCLMYMHNRVYFSSFVKQVVLPLMPTKKHVYLNAQYIFSNFKWVLSNNPLQSSYKQL